VIAWTGAGNDRLNVMQSRDGASWEDKVTLNDTSPSPPAIAKVGAELFLAWRGGDNRLNVRRSGDGRNWAPKVTLSDTTDSGPAVGAAGPTLLLAWRGRGNNRLNVMAGAPGGLLPGVKVTLDDTTDDRPAMCSRGPKAFLAWRGTGDGLFNIISSVDGAHWASKFTSSEVTLGGPAIAPFGTGMIVRVWTDENAPRSLLTRVFSQA
jgi:hypothetical protein